MRLRTISRATPKFRDTGRVKRPGEVIEAKFKKEIQEELTKKLVSKSYRDAIAEKQLRVVSLTSLEDVKLAMTKRCGSAQP